MKILLTFLILFSLPTFAQIVNPGTGGGGSGTVTSVSVTTANGVSGSVATATTTPAITLTLGAITPTSTNGVSAATMAFMDATSSVQTQLNAKAPIASPTFTGTVTIPNGGVFGTPTSVTLTNATSLPISTGVSGLGTGIGTFLGTPSSANLAAAITDETGSGAAVFANTPTLVTPVLGAATATSLLASGNVDGTAPVTITTGTTATLGGTFRSGYTLNQEATAATAVAYTLPTAAAGRQYCIGNSWNGSAATTGVLTLNTSASGQFIIFTDGTLSATGGNITSGGAAADAACVIGVDATHWQLYVQRGTWTKH